MVSKRMIGLCALAVMVVAGEVMAAPFTQVSYTADNGNAEVTIKASASGSNTQLEISLTNLTPATDTTSAANLLTGLELFPQDISTYTILSQDASKDFVFDSSTTGSTVADADGPNWALVTSPGHALYFNGFGTGGKPIIGTAAKSGDEYPNANASLTSDGHGTDVYETATFTLLVPGSLNATSITGVYFLFNTNGDVIIPGGNPPPVGGSIPEPATLCVLGLGAAGLMLRRPTK